MKQIAVYVAGLLFHSGHVALVRKAKPVWQAGKLNGIGGKVEPGENPLTAMQREFTEETGYEPALDWEHFATLTGHSPSDVDGFCVRWYRAVAQDATQPRLIGTTEEPIEWWHCRDLYNTIRNLPYLVAMADACNRPEWPLFIAEGASCLPPRTLYAPLSIPHCLAWSLGQRITNRGADGIKVLKSEGLR